MPTTQSCPNVVTSPSRSESTVAKHTPFHGRENENVNRWLQRFTLYLANRKIDTGSDQAAIQLALHLEGPLRVILLQSPKYCAGFV